MAVTTDPTLPSGPTRASGRDRRRWSRYDVGGGLPAVLVAKDRRIACRIENISLTGARLRVAEPAPWSLGLRLELAQGRGLGGRCVWQTSDSIGVSFGLTAESVDLAMACIRRATEEAAQAMAPSAASEPRA